MYWKPVWHVLEGHFKLVLANAAHVRCVPGRKTDVSDAMLLADLGADVIRVDRPGTKTIKPERYALSRGRRSITIDMKNPDYRHTLVADLTRLDQLHMDAEDILDDPDIGR